MNWTSPLPHSRPVQNTVVVSVRPQLQLQVPPVTKHPLFSSGARKREYVSKQRFKKRLGMGI
jgi:hypothetical protein